MLDDLCLIKLLNWILYGKRKRGRPEDHRTWICMKKLIKGFTSGKTETCVDGWIQKTPVGVHVLGHG